MKEKKRTCPRCGNRQVVSLPKCTECGLKFSRLENATHAEAMKALKEKDKKRVVYVNDIPSDLSKVKFIISLFFGVFGCTSFYVGKKKKAWFSLISIIGLFTFMIIQGYMKDAGVDYTLLNYFVTTTFGLASAFSVLMWAGDVIAAISHTYKFPVALPKDNPYKQTNIRKELYDEIMKEKEKLEKENENGENVEALDNKQEAKVENDDSKEGKNSKENNPVNEEKEVVDEATKLKHKKQSISKNKLKNRKKQKNNAKN